MPAMLALIGIVALLIAFSGGDGLSYFIRMALVLCVCTWLYAEQKPGDFLSVSVWTFGKHTGFDIGMIGECAVQMAESLFADILRVQTAMKLKGQSWEIKNLVPAMLVLIHDAVTRAGDNTELLAVRGYHRGGMVCPAFSIKIQDAIAGICAICVVIVAFFPISEFFILYR
jgi:energy-coupling factor transport system permease protein